MTTDTEEQRGRHWKGVGRRQEGRQGGGVEREESREGRGVTGGQGWQERERRVVY